MPLPCLASLDLTSGSVAGNSQAGLWPQSDEAWESSPAPPLKVSPVTWISWTSNTQNQLVTSGAGEPETQPATGRISASRTAPCPPPVPWSGKRQVSWGDRMAWCIVLNDTLVSMRLDWAELGWFPDCLALLSGEFLSDVVLPLSGSGPRKGKVWGLGKLEPSYVHLLIQGLFSPYHSLFTRNLDAHPSLKVHECSGLLKLGWNYWDWKIWGPGSSRGSPRMCCLPSCQDLCQDSGKETWDSSLEQGGVLLKVGTTQPAEADRLPGAPVSNLPAIPSGDAGCVQEEEARQPGDRDVTPDSWSLQAPLATDLLVSPTFCSLLITPLSSSCGKPKNILVPTWGKHGSSHSSCFSYVLSPAYSSCRIREPWDPSLPQASFFSAFCCSNPPWRQWMPWVSLLEWRMRQGNDDRGAWTIMKKG